MTTYHLDDNETHNFWDNQFPARLRIQPGDTVVIETRPAANDQLHPGTTTEDLLNWDPTQSHALTGPIAIDGAEPGDALVVEIVDISHKGWGANWINPEKAGLLHGEFDTHYLHQYRLDGEWCWFNDRIRIPFEPFCGVMGVARAEPGRVRTIPPRENGGNVDIRHLTRGATAFFPVLVPDALFACGDGHATQGDGEVNGTAVECPLTITIRFDLQKGANIPELRFMTPPGRPLTVAGTGGYFATTAHGPDLHEDARQAIRYMLDHLVAAYGLTREEAYCLCGAAVDLKISEVVNVPNWVVSAYLPLDIFLD
jgi:acetamidase/formamidase